MHSLLETTVASEGKDLVSVSQMIFEWVRCLKTNLTDVTLVQWIHISFVYFAHMFLKCRRITSSELAPTHLQDKHGIKFHVDFIKQTKCYLLRNSTTTYLRELQDVCSNLFAISHCNCNRLRDKKMVENHCDNMIYELLKSGCWGSSDLFPLHQLGSESMCRLDGDIERALATNVR
jgi:hypothetical protein